MLAATDVTSRYEGVLPYLEAGLSATHPPAAWVVAGGGKERRQPQQLGVQAEGGAFSGERAEQRLCKEPGFIVEAVLVPGSAARLWF